jgi:protein phosphatase
MTETNLQFNIAGFTHRGTEREINQDRILIQDSIYNEGLYSFSNVDTCFCFVADGIGGGPSGELASQFVLEKVRTRIAVEKTGNSAEIRDLLEAINGDLLQFGKADPLYLGSGTTLVGLIISNDQFHIINAGDSEVYVSRDKMLLKVSEDQVVDPFKSDSPLLSYFGGKENALSLDLNSILKEVVAGDVILLTSDGLFKSLDNKQVSAILSSSRAFGEKAKFILQKALEKGADDNLGCILIEVVALHNSDMKDINTADVPRE